MQSHKKHKRPKLNKMAAHEFAIPFAQNIGSYKEAVITSDNYAEKAREQATRDDLTKEEVKELKRTANFYDNVSGILRKAQVKMGAQPTPKRNQEAKGVKKDTSDRRPATT